MSNPPLHSSNSLRHTILMIVLCLLPIFVLVTSLAFTASLITCLQAETF